MTITNKKIKLIIPSDDIHREIFKLKAEKSLRNANEVLKLLLDTYKVYNIKLGIKKEEANILNSNPIDIK